MNYSIVGIIQFFFFIVIGLYFWNLLRSQQGTKVAVQKESRKEMDKLRRLRRLSLTEPLAEKTRPSRLEDIIGQEEGIQALKAALCGPNPQHVIIYGPPGIGKTAAARVVLEEAKKNTRSPFNGESKFIELDATTARFDERGIADPLIGSVHDPIYQGAGAMGVAGIPQPKPGAVTKAHGGMLFIDEIGELHPIQMNKLLKVLEDRKVFLESAYYNEEDPNVPQHIHEIFQNGLPADFRMVGATTRMPHEIPPAIRSRCLEVYFRGLVPEEIGVIAKNAAQKMQFKIQDQALEVIKRYANNGREAVNMIQIGGGLALEYNRHEIHVEDMERVINSGQYNPRPEKKVPTEPQVGYVNGLAVTGPNMGVIIELEVSAIQATDGQGSLKVTGVIDEEEMGGAGRKMKRQSMARGSVENVLTVLRRYTEIDPRKYDLHVNFPGGIPIDGPSAGVTVATAIYSALTEKPVSNLVAMTGEVSIRGLVKPIGGVVAKIDAARRAGAKKIIIPKENWQAIFEQIKDAEIIPVTTLDEVFNHAFKVEEVVERDFQQEIPIMTASPVPGVSTT